MNYFDMRKTFVAVILCMIFASHSIRAQTVAGISYRTFVDGSSSWGGSMEIGHEYDWGIFAGQFSYVSRSPAPGSTDDPARRVSGDQIGIAIIAAGKVGKWFHIGPEIGVAFGANNNLLNVGGTVKIAFAAIPESAMISLDYGTQTGVGIGLIFPSL